MSDITTITVTSYMTDPEHKALAHELLASAGLDRDDCTRIEKDGDGWVFTFIERDRKGRPKNSTRTVRWPS